MDLFPGVWPQTNYFRFQLPVFETGSSISEAKLTSKSLRNGSTERTKHVVQSWNAVFFDELGYGVPTKFFCSSDIYGRCWSRILMMPSLHPWANWVICKLGRSLSKFHFWVITQILYKINEKLWCLHLGFHGQWFWLDHCREDPAICICIIMQTRSAITEIASLCPTFDRVSEWVYSFLTAHQHRRLFSAIQGLYDR